MQVCKVETPTQLLKALEKISHFPNSGSWFFRGQGSSAWPLTPTLFRIDALRTTAARQAFETSMLATLRDELEFRSTLPRRFLTDNRYLLALARHHGAPTRVLDWSRSAHVAAYFATESASQSTDEVSVFAIANIISVSESIGRKVEIVGPAEAANPNLKAQRGVLCIHDWETQDLWDTALERPVSWEQVTCSSLIDDRFIRVDLPRAQVPELRSRLRAEAIDGGSMYPGLGGLVRESVNHAWTAHVMR